MRVTQNIEQEELVLVS